MGALASLAESWWAWMGPMLVQSSLLIGLLVILEKLFSRRLRPGLMMGLWLIAIGRLLVPPSLYVPFSLAGLIGPAVAPPAEATVLAVPATTPQWIGPAALVWLVIALSLAAIEAARHLTLRRRLATEAVRVRWPAWLADEIRTAARTMRARTPARILASRRAATPAVAGFPRPWLVLPADLTRRHTRSEIGHMLLHEMAHLRRRDPLLRAACRMLACLYWINPLVWLAARRVAALSELCCDARVANALGPECPTYRRTLIRSARFLLEPQAALAPPALGFHGGTSLLALRLAWLQRQPARPGPMRRLLGAAVIAAAALFVLPMGAAPPAASQIDAAALLQARLILSAAASGQRVSSLRLQHAARILSAHQSNTSNARTTGGD